MGSENKKQITIKKIPGETNVAELGTKSLDPKKHQLLMQQLPLAHAHTNKLEGPQCPPQTA